MTASSGPPPPSALPLAELIDPDEVLESTGDLRVPIAAITHDSRRATAGCLFVAYRGVYEDVHRYIPDALRRGAVAALVERSPSELVRDLELPADAVLVQVASARYARSAVAARLYGEPSKRMIVVGVTGTDGKTTTSTLVHGLVAAAGRRAGLVSTVGAYSGDAAFDTGLHTTTPEAEDVQAFLAAMVAEGTEIAVLEVTSHGLDQHRVAHVSFDVAAITNITHEALEYHDTMAAYRAAKTRLFQMLAEDPTSQGIPKTAVLNAGDASYETLARVGVERQLTYSTIGPAQFTASGIGHSPTGLSFTAHTPVGDVAIHTPLLGYYNVANILAALAVAHALGIPSDAWPAGIAATHGIPGRMELIDEGQPFLAVVDFAHTPNGMRHALDTARELRGPAGRVIVVFGCAGLRDRAKRGLMGATAGEMADLALVTAEDPRTEPVEEILHEIADGVRSAGGREGIEYQLVPDRFEAIRRACAVAKPADVVIVLGKGHEQSMCFGTEEYAWDDRTAVRHALRGEHYGNLPTATPPDAAV